MMKRLALSVLAMAPFALGCADDGKDDTPRLEAAIGYSGPAHGTLVLAAFPTKPPMGAPTSFAQSASPTFPATLVLETVEPGTTLYVLAMLDVAPASPQQPGPEDRTAWSDAVTIAAEGATPIPLDLVDP